MKTITLKQYLQSKGYRLKWVAEQIGFEYHAFCLFLKNNSTLKEEQAKALEFLTQKDWLAVKKANRFKMEISVKD